MGPGCWLLKKKKKKDPGFRKKVPEETSSHLLLGAQDQRLGTEQEQLPCGSTGTLLATVKRRKLAWFRHVTCHDSLSKTILQGPLEVGQRRGLRKKCWMDNIKEWTPPRPHAGTAYRGLLQKAGRESPLNRLPCPPDDPIQSELN